MESVFHHPPAANVISLPDILLPSGKPVTDINELFNNRKAKKAKKVKDPKKQASNNTNEGKKEDDRPFLSSSMKTVFQVLSHGTSDCRSPSLLLQTEKGEKHLFGRICEGFQRTVSQNHIKFTKLQNIFISGPIEWSSVGGLPGMILTLADQGLDKLALQTAVSNLPWACATWRNFIFRGRLNFTLKNAEAELYSDKYICVKGVSIYPDSYTHQDYMKNYEKQEEVNKESYEIFRQLFSTLENESGTNKGKKSQKQEASDKTGSRSSSPSRLDKNGKKRSPPTGTALAPVAEASLPPINIDPRVSCYIIQVRPTRGKFLVEKAKALGVPPGVLYSHLTSGQSVVTPEGKTVHPEQVLEPTVINKRSLVIDCPGKEYVNDLINNHDWRQSLHPSTQASNLEMKNPEASPDHKRIKMASDPEPGYAEPVSTAYHFLGASVDPFHGPYFDWLTDPNSTVFAPDCMHFITHPEYAPDGITLEAAAILNMKLRQIFPENFKRLYTADPIKQFPDPETNNYKIYPMYTLGTVSVEPKIAYQTSLQKCNGKVDWPALEEAAGLSQKNALDDAQISEMEKKIEEEVPENLRDIEIITLGTGSAAPNKYRNVISTLVRIPSLSSTQNEKSFRSILFDCGENSLWNMKRIYGPEELNKRVAEIDILYISHLHADHHLGAISFIENWLTSTSATPERTLYVMGPWKYFDFLKEWSQLEHDVSLGRLNFVDNESFMIGRGYDNVPVKRSHSRSPSPKGQRLDGKFFQDTGLKAVRTCKAIHCDLSYCVSFEFLLAGADKSTFKVSYSGDTRPTEFFATKIGYNSDLLIHEATHDNDLEEEAFKKRHSTISEALSISRSMNARYTVLTHFSQRYPKLPNLTGLSEYTLKKHKQRQEKNAANVRNRRNSKNGSSSPQEVSKSDDEEMKDADTSETTEEQIPQLPVFAFAFDGLHLKLQDIPKQRLKFDRLEKLFDEVVEMEAIEEEEDKNV